MTTSLSTTPALKRAVIRLLELDEMRNCIHVQAQLDRGEQATVGTCWWDARRERLYAHLPEDACRYCWTRELLKRLRAGDAKPTGQED